MLAPRRPLLPQGAAASQRLAPSPSPSTTAGERAAPAGFHPAQQARPLMRFLAWILPFFIGDQFPPD